MIARTTTNLGLEVLVCHVSWDIYDGENASELLAIHYKLKKLGTPYVVMSESPNLRLVWQASTEELKNSLGFDINSLQFHRVDLNG